MSLFLRTTLFATFTLVVLNHCLFADPPKSGGKIQTSEGSGSGIFVSAKASKGEGIHFTENNKGIDAKMKVDGKVKALHFKDADEMKEKGSDIYPRYEKLAKMVSVSTKTTASASVTGETNENGEQKKFSDRIDSKQKKGDKEDKENAKEENKSEESEAAPDLSEFPEIAEAQKQFAIKVKEMKKQISQDWDRDTYMSEKSSFSSQSKKVSDRADERT